MITRTQRGVSLLEVILALAILAGAMAAIGELLRVGARHATAAFEQSVGQLHCQSILDQIRAGVLPASSAQDAPLPLDPDWLYSVEVQSLSLDGLLQVVVHARRADDTRSQPRLVTLVQWVIDPQYLQQKIDEAEAQQASAEEETGT